MAKARKITGLDANASTGKNARAIARTRLDEMEEWGRYVHEPERSDELHNLRIAAKRLRYTLEIFADVLPAECSLIVKEVTDVQEELGALHDSDVKMALLTVCLNRGRYIEQGEANNDDHALALRAQQQVGKHLVSNIELVARLLDRKSAPTTIQQEGLNRLLQDTKSQRVKQYDVFREHWDALHERDFRREVLDMLDV